MPFRELTLSVLAVCACRGHGQDDQFQEIVDRELACFYAAALKSSRIVSGRVCNPAAIAGVIFFPSVVFGRQKLYQTTKIIVIAA